MDDRYADGSYLSGHPLWHAERSEWKAAHVLRGLEAADVRPQRVVDVGCGAAAVLATVASSLGLAAAVGYDPSPDAPMDERAVGVVDRRMGGVADVDGEFDVALVLDVFEHVDDYLGFISACRPLAPVAVFHVPLEVYVAVVLLGRFGQSREIHGHLHHFSRRTALDTIRHCGYEVVHHHLTKGWEGTGRNPRSPMNILRRVVYRLSPTIAERVTGGLALLVVARRPSPGGSTGAATN